MSYIPETWNVRCANYLTFSKLIAVADSQSLENEELFFGSKQC